MLHGLHTALTPPSGAAARGVVPPLVHPCSAAHGHTPWRRPLRRGVMLAAMRGALCRRCHPRSPRATEVEAPSGAPPASPAPIGPRWVWEESSDAVRAYATLTSVLLLGALPLWDEQPWADLPYFVGLALVTIYVGAHRGLTTRQRQQISFKEGLLAPVFASAALFGVYLLIKFFPDLSLQALVNAYFFLLGSLAILGAAGPVLRSTCGPLGEKSIRVSVPEGWLLDDSAEPVTEATLAPTDVAAAVLALVLATAELRSGHMNFTLSNLVACLVASDILQLLGIRSFRTAVILLVGLLAYDVFWVFGSPRVVGENVMLAVATSDVVVGPTRLLFPKGLGGDGEAAAFPFSLLGLGDVAVPGLLACLALRYDASRSTDMRARAAAAAGAISSALAGLEPGASGRRMGEAAAAAADAAYDAVADVEASHRNALVNETPPPIKGAASTASGAGGGSSSGGSSISSEDAGDTACMPVSDAVLVQRPYFTAVSAAYVVGLLAAFAANTITHLGQPALLYIVPSVLSAVGLTALARGEVGRIWAFTDAPSFGALEAFKEKGARP